MDNIDKNIDQKTDIAPVSGAPIADQNLEGVGTVTDENGPKADNPKVDEASGNQLEGNAPDGLSLSEGEAAEARKEGAKEAAKESAKESYQYLTDGNLPGDPTATRFINIGDIQQEAYLLDLDPEQFEKAVSGDEDATLSEEKVAGLLSLERSGKNRTPYVQACMKRLDVKSPYEVTHAGPAYTNDITSNRTEF